MATPRIPLTVVHHSRFDPRTHTGGVETFGRNLALVFDEVLFTTPGSPEIARAVERRLPVICDNQTVLDWPDGYPVIGFMHGVAAQKAQRTGGRTGKKLAKGQAAAARRPHTLWVACAQWISDAFAALHQNPAHHVVYHQVDVERFDGRLDNAGSRLVLHDGRSEHKGKRLFERLAKALPQWSFESLDCKPHEVPDRMRRAAAFMHLSRYEGNSIVCNEAMAMDLPCLFTRVGLMRDGTEQFDVSIIEPEHAFDDRKQLVAQAGAFLEGLATRSYHPRAWTMQHATPQAHIEAWIRVMDDLAARTGWSLSTTPAP